MPVRARKRSTASTFSRLIISLRVGPDFNVAMNAGKIAIAPQIDSAKHRRRAGSGYSRLI